MLVQVFLGLLQQGRKGAVRITERLPVGEAVRSAGDLRHGALPGRLMLVFHHPDGLRRMDRSCRCCYSLASLVPHRETG